VDKGWRIEGIDDGTDPQLGGASSFVTEATARVSASRVESTGFDASDVDRSSDLDGLPHDDRSASSRVMLQLRGIQHQYTAPDGSEPFVSIAEFNLAARQGEFISIVGPSGCGKSTLLMIVAGLTRATAGEVVVLGKPARGVSKDVGLVFQRDALLPWRTALQNVELPLRFRRVPKRDARLRARDWLARMGLSKFEDRYPSQLSGGQRKRVSLAATLVYEPTILLMDEPFSALDVQTRDFIESDILRVWQETRQTVLFVTHDLEEAIALSDRVVVMTASPGRALADYPVPLNRPRDVMQVKHVDEFHDLHRQIWKDLRVEVLKAARAAVTDTEHSEGKEPQ
jgi:NitT/TauT family transport system ATP-binding protein